MTSTRLRRTGEGRDINRHSYSAAELQQALQQPVVTALLALLRLRNDPSGFPGTVLDRRLAGAHARLRVGSGGRFRTARGRPHSDACRRHVFATRRSAESAGCSSP